MSKSPNMRAPGRVLLLALVFAVSASRGLMAQDLGEMAELIRGGQPGEAYRQLVAAEETRAGEVQFDYLLGLAALESGQPARATLAFERVLALQPNHLGARLDMARANFALGQDELAREQLLELRGMNPPAAAKRAIDGYLAALDERANPTQWSAYIESGGGYDTNANNAPSADGFFVPALGGDINIATDNTARSDLFFESRGGVDVRHAVNPRLTLRAGAVGSIRLYDDVTDLDTRDIAGYVGVETRHSRDTISAGMRFSHEDLDDDPYRKIISLELDWRKPLDARTEMVSYLQYSGLRYDRLIDKPNDANLLLVGTGVQHALGARARTLLSASVYGGVEDARNDRLDGDRNIVGVRFGAQHLLRDDVSLYGGGGFQYSDYEDVNALFLRERTDRLYDVSAGVQWRFLPAWSLRSGVRWSYTHSNIKLDQYQRTEVAVKIRRTFD